ncbi:MAG: SiaC family regulatory phosphoprotein, partial [Flexibacteraceae bacterium]
MVNFKSEGTLNTPTISLNAEIQVLTFSGRSLPENAPQFYSPVFDWCNEFVENCNKDLP